MSGIPFGIHAEQLTAPNLWRGMVFAEGTVGCHPACRVITAVLFSKAVPLLAVFSAAGARPAPELWKAWDSLGLVDTGVQLVGW